MTTKFKINATLRDENLNPRQIRSNGFIPVTIYTHAQTQFRYNIVQRWYVGVLPVTPYQRFTPSKDLLGK